MPSDVASAVGKASISDRSQPAASRVPKGRRCACASTRGRWTTHCAACWPGSETPLILAAAQPLDAIFRSVCSYPHLVRESDRGQPRGIQRRRSGPQASRAMLDRLHRGELDSLRALFETRSAEGRTTTDIAQAARRPPSAPWPC